jgi:hypothetical protein
MARFACPPPRGVEGARGRHKQETQVASLANPPPLGAGETHGCQPKLTDGQPYVPTTSRGGGRAWPPLLTGAHRWPVLRAPHLLGRGTRSTLVPRCGSCAGCVAVLVSHQSAHRVPMTGVRGAPCCFSRGAACVSASRPSPAHCSCLFGHLLGTTRSLPRSSRAQRCTWCRVGIVPARPRCLGKVMVDPLVGWLRLCCR